MAWFNSLKSKHSPETQAGLDRLIAMRWPEFEALIAQAYQQRGYSVEKTGKGGLEGDIDLILVKDGRTVLVQCKQWKTRQVGIASVREMWGVLGHRNADALKIVSAGEFAEEAVQFVGSKPIELIDGERLLALVHAVGTVSPAATTTSAPPAAQPSSEPTCALCGSSMFKRYSRQTNQMFWSCLKYPACKGSQPV